MLEERGLSYRYREYTRDPLSAKEIEGLLAKLGVGAAELVRKNDPAFKKLGLTGGEGDVVLVGHMASNPTLLQRPIGILRGRAIVGRPAERLLELFEA